jgi:quercetin dioxygenase-like cupin family protein
MPASISSKVAQAPVLGELELAPWSVGDDPTTEGRLALPISAASGSPNTLVYLEIDPGKRIAPHTHTADEVFVVLEGEGIVTAGVEQWEASAGAIAVAPAFARHSWVLRRERARPRVRRAGCTVRCRHVRNTDRRLSRATAVRDDLPVAADG